MQYTHLGRTGLRVSPICLGTMNFGWKTEEPQSFAIMDKALDLGINFFDVTIDSEKEALGRNLRDMPPPYDIVIQTRPEGMCYSYDENNARMLDLALLRAEVQRGLRLIGREVVDFYNFGLLAWSTGHGPDYLEKLAHNIAELKRDGLIRFAVADSFSGEALYLDMIASGELCPARPDVFEPLVDSMLHRGDPFMVLADYDAYIKAQERVDTAFRDTDAWTRTSILNCARMGKFSADRAVDILSPIGVPSRSGQSFGPASAGYGAAPGDQACLG